MLEMMLSVKPRSMKLYPDSGPGPKVLKYGNEDLGYFGLILKSDFIQDYDLREQVAFNKGTLNSRMTGWFKMFIGGKVIFFANDSYYNSVLWLDLYKAGIVSGTDDDGISGEVPGVNQLRFVTTQEDTFKARLFSTIVTDPQYLASTPITIGTGVSIGAEWTRVITALKQWKVFVTGSYAGYNWASGTSIAGTGGMRHAFRQDYINGWAQTSEAAWVPVLELIPKDQVPLRTVDQQSMGAYAAIVPTIPDIGDSTPVILPIYRMGAAGITLANALSETTTIAGIDAIQRTSIAYTTTLPNALSADITFE